MNIVEFANSIGQVKAAPKDLGYRFTKWDTDSQKSIDFLLNPICVPRIYVTMY